MPEQAEEENEQYNNGVVHAKECKVCLDSLETLVEGGGEVESMRLNHLLPWSSCRQPPFDPFFCK